MSKINVWYVVGREDNQSCFNYTQVTPRGEWFNSWEEADQERLKMEKQLNERLFVFRRTCEVLHESQDIRPNSCS